jgi:hypothetical protein
MAHVAVYLPSKLKALNITPCILKKKKKKMFIWSLLFSSLWKEKKFLFVCFCFETGSHYVARLAWSLLCSSAWLWTYDPPISICWVLRSQEYVTHTWWEEIVVSFWFVQ